jgi:hypothetical protein
VDAAAAAARERDRGEHDTDHRQDRETNTNPAQDEPGQPAGFALNATDTAREYGLTGNPAGP